MLDIKAVGLKRDDQTVRLLLDRVRGAWRHFQRQSADSGAWAILRGHPRHSDVTDQDQSSAPAELQRFCIDRREGAVQEVQRDDPATAHASRRSPEQHQLSGNGDQLLVRRQDDDVVPVQHAEGAGARVFSDIELEQSRQIVERDHFVSIALERLEHVSPR